jgi:hypothetical protein
MPLQPVRWRANCEQFDFSLIYQQVRAKIADIG